MTQTPETSGIIGMRPNRKREAMSERTVAPMKTPVPQKMPARALTMKNTTSGPTSTASFSSWTFSAGSWLGVGVVRLCYLFPQKSPYGARRLALRFHLG